MLKKICVAFFVRALGAIATFVMTVIVARGLPVEQAGYFFLAFAFLSMLTPLSVFGTAKASLRFIGASFAENKWSEILGISLFAFFSVISLNFIFATLIWWFAPFLTEVIWKKPEMSPLIKTSSFVLMSMSTCLLLSHFLQAIQKTIASISVLSINLPIGLSILLFFSEEKSATNTMSLLLIASLLNLVFGLISWFFFLPARKPLFPKIKKFVVTCFPIWVIAFMIALTYWGNQFIAGVWVGAEDLAYLAVAQRTGMLVTFIMIAANLVTAPRFAALYEQGKHSELKSLAIQTTGLMFVVGSIVILAIILFPSFVLSLFGDQFREATHLLIILSLGQYINVITGSSGNLLIMSGHEKDYRNAVLFSGPLSIILGFALIPNFGVTGAAIATALGVSIQNLGAAWLVKKRLGFNIFSLNFLRLWNRS